MRYRIVLGWLGVAVCSWFWLAVQLGVFTGAALADASPAVAQDAAEAPAQGDAVAPAPGAGAGEEAPPPPKSFLRWLYDSLRLRYVIIFLFLTFNLVALFAMNILALRRDNVIPPALVQEFEARLNDKRYQEAYDLARNDESFLGRVLAAGMANLSTGHEAAIGAMEEVGEEENMKMEQRLSYVSLIGQLGPMFGLLGTVDGMVMAFNVIAQSNVTPKPSQLADGIGTALVTTVVGLWIAIPSIAFYHIVRNRLSRLILQAGVVSEDLMKRFSTVTTAAKKP